MHYSEKPLWRSDLAINCNGQCTQLLGRLTSSLPNIRDKKNERMYRRKTWYDLQQFDMFCETFVEIRRNIWNIADFVTSLQTTFGQKWRNCESVKDAFVNDIANEKHQ